MTEDISTQTKTTKQHESILRTKQINNVTLKKVIHNSKTKICTMNIKILHNEFKQNIQNNKQL